MAALATERRLRAAEDASVRHLDKIRPPPTRSKAIPPKASGRLLPGAGPPPVAAAPAGVPVSDADADALSDAEALWLADADSDADADAEALALAEALEALAEAEVSSRYRRQKPTPGPAGQCTAAVARRGQQRRGQQRRARRGHQASRDGQPRLALPARAADLSVQHRPQAPSISQLSRLLRTLGLPARRLRIGP